MANADEPFRQHMEQEPADKFLRWDGHQSGFFRVAVISCLESDLAILATE